MTSKARAKGYRTVKKGTKIFLNKGYIGANLEKTGRFIKEKDLFGLWDNLFIRDKTHVFVQFKTNKKLGVKRFRKWLGPYLEFGKKHGSELVRYEIWNKIDRKYFEIVDCVSETRLKNERFI